MLHIRQSSTPAEHLFIISSPKSIYSSGIIQEPPTINNLSKNINETTARIIPMRPHINPEINGYITTKTTSSLFILKKNSLNVVPPVMYSKKPSL